MLIVLDNAESILDPQGANGQEINAVVEELSQFDNVCLCITSRLTTVPPDCKTLDIPTLPMEAARDAFYRIYEYGGRSDSVNDILEQLEFHPLSVTLLATVAHQNKWDNNRLSKEWKQRQTGVLQTGYNRSLARTIELSLASPMFRELGPDARGLLEVIAFFPQGIDENNLDWLFPGISNRAAVFDAFCVLSLACRSGAFITMLAPLRDHLRPKDPMSSPLLCATKDRYFTRMAVKFSRHKPVFRESRWIVPEDVNVEHLVDVFTSVDANADEVWEACSHFIKHLRFNKPRHTVLRKKIEGLPNDHRYKTTCLFDLSRLLNSVGNHVERKRYLDQTLELAREQGDRDLVIRVLKELSDASRMVGLREEGIRQAREALEIYQQLGATVQQAKCLYSLARLLLSDEQLDAAKEALSRAIDLLPEKGQEFLVSKSQRLLGNIYHFGGDTEKAIHHLQAALAMASPFAWHAQLFFIHNTLALLFLDQGEFDSAQAHAEQAKSHSANDTYHLGRAMHLQAKIWYGQGRLKEAESEALRAFETLERLGTARYLDSSRALLHEIQGAMNGSSTTDDSNSNGEPLEWVLPPTPVNSTFQAHGTPSITSA